MEAPLLGCGPPQFVAHPWILAPDLAKAEDRCDGAFGRWRWRCDAILADKFDGVESHKTCGIGLAGGVSQKDVFVGTSRKVVDAETHPLVIVYVLIYGPLALFAVVINPVVGALGTVIAAGNM